MRSRRYVLLTVVALAVMVLAMVVQEASAWPFSRLVKSKPDPVNSSLQDYLQSVRVANTVAPTTVGSLWSGVGALAVLATDYRARNPGDLVGDQFERQLHCEYQRRESAVSRVHEQLGDYSGWWARWARREAGCGEPL